MDGFVKLNYDLFEFCYFDKHFFFIFLIFMLLSFQNGVNLIILSGECCPLLRNDLEKDGAIILEKFPIILMENMSDIIGFELLDYAEDCISVSVLRCLRVVDLFDVHTFFKEHTSICERKT